MILKSFVAMVVETFSQMLSSSSKRMEHKAVVDRCFATFLLLSFVKYCSLSLNLLAPILTFNIRGILLSHYLFYDGTTIYFGKEHLPYGIQLDSYSTKYLLM